MTTNRWARQSGVLLLAFSMGCASAAPRSSFVPRWFPSIRNSAERDRSQSDTSTGEEEEDREPLIAQNEESSPDGKSRVIRHDPATRMLIEAELRDASPTDREEWIALLESVESSQVPALLQMRRFSKNDSNSPAMAESGNAASSKTIEQATAEMTDDGSSSRKIVTADAGDTTSRTTESRTTESPPAEKAALAKADESQTGRPATAESPLTSGWPQRFKSLADPTRIWTHPGEITTGDSETNGEKATLPKNERTTFGLPLIIGNQAKADAALADFHAREAAAVEQNQSSAPIAAATRSMTPPRLTPGSQLWEDEIQRLISLLEAEASGKGNGDARDETRKQVALRMLYLIEDQPQKAQQAIPGLPAPEQEFWTDLFLGLGEHLDRSSSNDAGERATRTISYLNTATSHLQQTARLRLRNIHFCEKIHGFGNYEPFQTDTFSPGQALLVYGEIRNFTSDVTADGNYRTRIRSTIEIYTDGGEQQLVDRSSFDATEDRCRTPRSDYFHSYRISLPAHLSRGPHVLKLMIQDELSGKMTTESVPFTIN